MENSPNSKNMSKRMAVATKRPTIFGIAVFLGAIIGLFGPGCGKASSSGPETAQTTPSAPASVPVPSTDPPIPSPEQYGQFDKKSAGGGEEEEGAWAKVNALDPKSLEVFLHTFPNGSNSANANCYLQFARKMAAARARPTPSKEILEADSGLPLDIETEGAAGLLIQPSSVTLYRPIGGGATPTSVQIGSEIMRLNNDNPGPSMLASLPEGTKLTDEDFSGKNMSVPGGDGSIIGIDTEGRTLKFGMMKFHSEKQRC